MAGGFGRRPFHFCPVIPAGRSAGHGVSKTARSHGREPAKDVREVTLIGKPHGTGNLTDGEIRFGQQSLRPLDARPHDIRTWRYTDGLAELTVEVEATDAGDARQIIEADGAGEPRIDVLEHASQLVAR